MTISVRLAAALQVRRVCCEIFHNSPNECKCFFFWPWQRYFFTKMTPSNPHTFNFRIVSDHQLLQLQVIQWHGWTVGWTRFSATWESQHTDPLLWCFLSPWGHGIRQTWAARMWLCSGFHQERRWSNLGVWALTETMNCPSIPQYTFNFLVWDQWWNVFKRDSTAYRKFGWHIEFLVIHLIKKGRFILGSWWLFVQISWRNPYCQVLCPSKWNPGPRARRWF